MTLGRVLTYVLVLGIRGYQVTISPRLAPTCRYYPSCSNYALAAVRVHGPVKGSLLTVARLARCNPWSHGGIDHVPARGKWRGDKHTIYEGGFRVPLIVSYPKQLAGGVRSAAYVTTADLFATIAEMHGIKDLPETTAPDSFTFAHVLRDPKAPSKRPHTVLNDAKGRQALRFGKWKMIDAKVPGSKDLSIELYNIESDPGESRNVAGKHPEIIAQGQKLLQTIRDANSSRKIGGL